MKSVLMVGGDIRQKIAATELLSAGYRVESLIDNTDEISDMNRFKAIVLPVPTTKNKTTVNAPLLDRCITLSEITDKLRDNCLLLTGNYKPEYRNYCDICKREDFAILNAVPSAEGALEIAMHNTKTTIWNSRVLVIGYGRIGRILCDRLIAFGARVTTTARNVKNFAELNVKKIPYINTQTLSSVNFEQFDIIINTVPSSVLTAKELSSCRDDCLLIELASAPFGIDKSYVLEKGLTYIYAPALPGKVAPITAGKILAKTIMNILNEYSIYPA